MCIKEDCFAYNGETKECKALTELVCKKEECSFYKTKAEYLDGISKLEGLEGTIDV